MKKAKILGELPICDRDTKCTNSVGKKDTDRLVWCRVATNLQFVKNVVSVKHNKMNHNKTKYACIWLEQIT